SECVLILVLEEHDLLEAELVVGRERRHELLDRRINRFEDRHAQQIALTALENALPNYVGRQRAREQNAHRRGRNPQSRYTTTEQLLIQRRREAVDNSKEPDEGGDGDEQRNGDEEAGNEAPPKPLHHRCPQWTAASSATPVRMRYHAKGANPCRRTMF